MNVQDIVALAKAGFTVEQIQKFATITTSEESQQTSKNETVKTTEDPKQIPGQQELKTPETADPMAALFAKIDALGSQMQAAALNNTNQPAVETVDDILASIINPPRKEGN